MSFCHNPKTLTRFWAALNTDYEALITKFMDQSGCRFMYFAWCARRMKINLIHLLTEARGKFRLAHYEKTTSLIIDSAKQIWLRPTEVNSSHIGVKRQIGGFYLTYLNYMKQSIEGHCRISLDANDILGILVWLQAIPGNFGPEVLDDIFEILRCLVELGAFEFCEFSAQYSLEYEFRNLANHAGQTQVKLFHDMKDVQDAIAFDTHNRKDQKIIVDYLNSKAKLVKEVLASQEPNPHPIKMESLDSSEVENQIGIGDFGLGDVHEILSSTYAKIREQVDRPVLTMQSLTSYQAVDRRMMMETRRRLQRNLRRTQLQDGTLPSRAPRPYVNEGGIFGRKKVKDDEQIRKRERKLCSSNLWTYIYGFEFGKWPTDQKPLPPPPPSAHK